VAKKPHPFKHGLGTLGSLDDDDDDESLLDGEVLVEGRLDDGSIVRKGSRVE